MSGDERLARVIPFPVPKPPPPRWTGPVGPKRSMPTKPVVRDAKLIGLPVAYLGRRVTGRGRRLMGQSPDDIEQDIQQRTARHFFEVLGELKGCAAKLGQVAAIYRAALPVEFVPADLAGAIGTEMGRLQDSAPPMPPEVVRQVMARNMGPDWFDDFQSFDEHPAAAASLGQVHRGVWYDGRTVAVKMMYPGARAAVDSNLRQLRGLSGLFGALFAGADVQAVIEMLCANIYDELNYRREGMFQSWFARAFAGDPEFVVPKVVVHSNDVLISDWVEGVPVSRVIESGDADERNRVAFQILRFGRAAHERCGAFAGDVHPGNFLVLPDGRLGVVDFGAAAEYPPQLRTMVAEIGEALYNGTPAEVEEALRRHRFIRGGQEFDAEELVRIAAPFLDILLRPELRLSNEWLREQVSAIAEIRLSNVFRQMTLPPELTVTGRAVVTGFGMLCQLGTQDSIRDEFLAWWPGLAEAVRRHEDRRDPAPTATPER
ncbi:ABC1 kinase family protein [Nocardia crassostreae]|uniref:ABC1 kinase family protein n=1 Tax=Nocardia crassostreae TaxID=53428 RepID=UPI000A022D53|nr:AarF/ABC1/UbiB kinase family protein [Nocardia crassostreae]